MPLFNPPAASGWELLNTTIPDGTFSQVAYTPPSGYNDMYIDVFGVSASNNGSNVNLYFQVNPGGNLISGTAISPDTWYFYAGLLLTQYNSSNALAQAAVGFNSSAYTGSPMTMPNNVSTSNFIIKSNTITQVKFVVQYSPDRPMTNGVGSIKMWGRK